MPLVETFLTAPNSHRAVKYTRLPPPVRVKNVLKEDRDIQNSWDIIHVRTSYKRGEVKDVR
jgi:hypothetical protein